MNTIAETLKTSLMIQAYVGSSDQALAGAYA